jgi:hypothetical protein
MDGAVSAGISSAALSWALKLPGIERVALALTKLFAGMLIDLPGK